MARKNLFQRRTDRPLATVDTQDLPSPCLPRPQQTSVQTINAPRRPVAIAGMASLQREPERHGSRQGSRHSSRYGTAMGEAAQPGYAGLRTSRAHTVTGDGSPGSGSPGGRSPGDLAPSLSPPASRQASKQSRQASKTGPSTRASVRLPVCLVQSHQLTPASRGESGSSFPLSARASLRSSTSTGLPTSSSAHSTPMATRAGTKESSRHLPALWTSPDAQSADSDQGLEKSEGKQSLLNKSWTFSDARSILAEIDKDDEQNGQEVKEQQGGVLPHKSAREIDAEFGHLCEHLEEHLGSPTALRTENDDEDWKTMAISKEVPKTKKTFAETICEQQGIIPTGGSSNGGSSSSTAGPADQGEQGQLSSRMSSVLERVRAKVQAVSAVNLRTGDFRRDVEIEAEWKARVAAKRLRERQGE